MKINSTLLHYSKLCLILIACALAFTAQAQVPVVTPKPTTPSSAVVFTAASANSLTISWTKGNGANRVVVARAENPVDSVPKDGSTYTASAVFGEGSDLGSNQYIVFNGSGSTVEVTNLNPATVYHFAVFEYNGSNGLSAFLNNAARADRTTLAAKPSLNASEITFDNVDLSSYTVNFESGNGTRRIVIAKKGTATTLEPQEGAIYTASSSFGAGTDLGGGNFVVFNGNGKTVALTGLSAGTTYAFAVYEYNGTNPDSYNYNKTNAPKAVQSTRFAEPTTATSNLTFTANSESSLTLNWMKGNGSSRIIIAHANTVVNQSITDGMTYTASSAFANGTDLGGGNYIVYNGTGTSVQVTGLQASKVYHFSVIEYNGSGTSSNYFSSNATTGSASTLTTEPTLNGGAIEFTAVTENSIRIKLAPGNGEGHLVVVAKDAAVSQLPQDGQNYLSQVGDTVFANGRDISPGSGNYIVYKGTGTSFTITNLKQDVPYHFAVFEYNGTGTGINYLTTNYINGKQSTLAAVPRVPASAINFSNITGTSMTVNWTNGDGANRILVARSGGIDVSQAPSKGTEYTANAVFGAGDNISSGAYVVYKGTGSSIDVKGLTPNTTYSYAVFEYNGSNTSNNYLVIDPIVQEKKSTLISKPTMAASNFVISTIDNDSNIAISWNKGNGNQRLLIIREGAPIVKFPGDGEGYVSSPVFGSDTADIGLKHYVCYQGNGSSAIVHGLAPDRAYYFALFEFNGQKQESSYLISAYPTANNLPPEPTVASASFVFKDVTPGTINVSWKSGDGVARILIVKENAAVNKVPVDGITYTANTAIGAGQDLGLANFVVYNGSNNNVDITGLKNNTLYHFALYEYNKDIEGPVNYAAKALTGSKSNVLLGLNMQRSSIINVFPNPSTGSFKIALPATITQGNIMITNLAGQLVYTSTLTTNQDQQQTIDSQLPAGYYQLTITSGTEVVNIPLIIGN